MIKNDSIGQEPAPTCSVRSDVLRLAWCIVKNMAAVDLHPRGSVSRFLLLKRITLRNDSLIIYRFNDTSFKLDKKIK